MNLRTMEKEDIPLITEWWNNLEVNGDYEFMPQMSRTEMEKRIEKESSEPNHGARVFFIEKKDGSKIGYVQYHPVGESPEMGYVIVPSERCKGYCSEATQVMVDYLFLSKEIVRIQAYTDVRNMASQRVLDRVGFKKEGVVRKCRFVKGEWRDSFLYSILREEWKEPRILTRIR